MANEPIVTLSGITKYYGTFPSLTDFSVTLPAGRVIGLLGPNGSGKTTLLKILAGLLLPDRGAVTILGNVPGIETRNLISYLSDKNSIPGWMTPNQAIAYFADFFADFDVEGALYMLRDLGLPADKPIRKLSKGMKEKVQLILTMSRRAKLYLLDEPISGVDPVARDYIVKTILSRHTEDSTILISTHLITDIETVMDDFIFIRDGRLICYDGVSALKERTGQSVSDLFREVFSC